eukprot:52473-Eustigmatos_ZCMA.PRE.1
MHVHKDTFRASLFRHRLTRDRVRPHNHHHHCSPASGGSSCSLTVRLYNAKAAYAGHSLSLICACGYTISDVLEGR